MIFSETCPHCRQETRLEKPFDFGGETEVEYQQDCERCGEPVVAVFVVEPVLREVRAA